MKRCLLAILLSMAVSGFVLFGTASADPGGPNLQQPISLTCTGGLHIVVNPGTSTNAGRVAWVIGSTSVFVTADLAITDSAGNTTVFFDSKKGLTTLITCSGDAGGGFTVTAIGFLTPH